MKNIFLTSLTVGSALASDAQKPGSRILRPYNPVDASNAGAVLCEFKTIAELFPNDLSSPIVADEFIDPDTDGDGVNYYGGYKTTINIPGHKTDGNSARFKDYEYFLYNGEQAVPGWVNVEQGQSAVLGVHITDHHEADASGISGLTGDDLDSFLKNAAGDDITDFPKSTYVNILQNEPALQSLAHTDPPDALHGSISCLQQIANPGSGARGGDLSSVFNANGVMTSCTYSGFQRSWILGVQSLCSKFATDKVAQSLSPASSGQLFAWFKQTEKPRSITIDTNDHNVNFVRTNLQTDTSGSETTAPTEILFAAPNTVRSDATNHVQTTGMQAFSAVTSVESSIKFGYTTARGTGSDVSNSVAAPEKCTTVTHGDASSSSANINLSGDTDATDASFNTACKVHGEAKMVVDFRDAPGTESCAASLENRVGQVELAIVQFARTHAVLSLPSLKNNTAHQFVQGASITGMHASGFTEAGETTTGASATGVWSCLDEDDCVLGDPYQVLGVTVQRAKVTGDAAEEKTITATVAAVDLVDPTSVGEYSYVMGIADFSISDCGIMNLDDPTQRGEYAPAATPASRRLGAAVSTPGNSVTQLHYASYKNY